MVEPTIEFKEPEKVAEPPQQVPKKPIILYKPTSYAPPPADMVDSSEFFKIKKKWLLVPLVLVLLLVVGLVGFLVGKLL
jgi:hypothetical protein